MECCCNEGWICEPHPNNLWPHDDGSGPCMEANSEWSVASLSQH
jgi:hypothetical protein